jgi:hypothetical protein
MSALKGEFNVTSWDERPYSEGDGGRKLTHATVTQDVSGDIVGRGRADWLMSYGEDGTAHFVGLQQFEGAIDGQTGTVVFETIGDFDGTEATWAARVLPGTGTGDWTTLQGEGHFRAPHGHTASFTLDCSFD